MFSKEITTLFFKTEIEDMIILGILSNHKDKTQIKLVAINKNNPQQVMWLAGKARKPSFDKEYSEILLDLLVGEIKKETE